MAAETDTPKYAVPPPIPPIATLVAVVVLDFVAPVPFIPEAVSLAVGIPLLALGFGLWAWGVAGMLRTGESPDPGKATAKLVISGPFRLSRNPIYTGGGTGLLGLAILLDTATGLAVVLVLGLIAHNITLAEERYLDARFGDEWREYRSRVRRWI